jgi:hypothetical protein
VTEAGQVADEPKLEAQWRAEFERDGERLVYDNITRAIYTDEKKRRAAFDWLASEASKRRARVFRELQIAMWMLVSVFAVIMFGAVAILMTLTDRAFGATDCASCGSPPTITAVWGGATGRF